MPLPKRSKQIRQEAPNADMQGYKGIVGHLFWGPEAATKQTLRYFKFFLVGFAFGVSNVFTAFCSVNVHFLLLVVLPTASWFLTKCKVLKKSCKTPQPQELQPRLQIHRRSNKMWQVFWLTAVKGFQMGWPPHQSPRAVWVKVLSTVLNLFLMSLLWQIPAPTADSQTGA